MINPPIIALSPALHAAAGREIDGIRRSRIARHQKISTSPMPTPPPAPRIVAVEDAGRERGDDRRLPAHRTVPSRSALNSPCPRPCYPIIVRINLLRRFQFCKVSVGLASRPGRG